MKLFNRSKFLLYFLITLFIVIVLVLSFIGCVTYKGTYSKEALKYNKEHKRK